MHSLARSEVIAQAPDRLAEFETDKFWLHAVEKLMEIADALDPQKTDSELSKIPAFHHMNSKISKQRDDYGVKLVLPALYSHLYCESETCWELKRGFVCLELSMHTVIDCHNQMQENLSH